MTSKLLTFLAGAVLLGLTLVAGHQAAAEQFQFQKLKVGYAPPQAGSHAGAVAGLIKSTPHRANAVRTMPLWGARYSR
jgi:hypothetical protein